VTATSPAVSRLVEAAAAATGEAAAVEATAAAAAAAEEVDKSATNVGDEFLKTI
jgi:hypothetical protein